MIDVVGKGLIWVFTSVPGIGDAMALVAAIVLIAWAVAISTKYWVFIHSPLSRALAMRNEVLAEIETADSLDVVRANFARRFSDIDAVMIQSGRGLVPMLRRSWEEYRETIVDVSAEDCLQNTARPEHFFLDLVDEAKTLGWLANIFIAIGLLVTFLGIIAALTAATASMQGTDADGMRAGLQQLLAITAAKFWASVGGLFGSILLRYVDHRSKQKLSRQLSDLCDYLEHGMAYLPPQRIAIEQLIQAKEQTPAVKDLATKLALTIDESFQRQVAPMVSALDDISRGIAQINGEGASGIAEAMREHAGAEMAELATAMTTFSGTLTTLSQSMGAQRDAMDSHLQMLEAAGSNSVKAAEAFERAASDVHVAVDPLQKVAQTIEGALEATRSFVAEQAASAETARGDMRDLSRQLAATGAAAEAAWSDYQGRFEAVDEALAAALASLSKASRDHADHVVQHVGEIDAKLGEGIQRLGAALEPLKEFSDQAEDFLGRLQQREKSTET
ncbi:hypothetical protein D1224_10900 [Henriciella barbarensis]|uniref:MotA/TolQ/ExbB proton channel domain-containing protein n=1 Tax=Henriciella barbarensis TaxID=86342 RepID=A0A399QX39_9PROT|nr:hypothetical protein [Henriciella barbarensis]RIJ22072.1 hypothetical protein D1224_10900 [Henriciella barbarensis]